MEKAGFDLLVLINRSLSISIWKKMLHIKTVPLLNVIAQFFYICVLFYICFYVLWTDLEPKEDENL